MKVILIMGLPASAKSSLVVDILRESETPPHLLSRDNQGGKLASLLPVMEESLADGHDVVLDNLFLTVESRAPFIAAAKAAGATVECRWMQTSFEDCQVNALNRMWDRYGQVFLTANAIQEHPEAKKDANIFPIGAMFFHKKRLHGDKKKGIPSGKPTKDEGFDRIIKVPFVRRPPTGSLRYPHTGKNKAILLDYDGTLRRDARDLGGEYPYPTDPSQVEILPNRTETLQRYRDEGYLLLGVTTQSGIGKGVVTAEMVRECLSETRHLVGHDIETLMCVHYNFPVQCFCRKPQPGLGVMLARKYDLDPSACVMVGDMKTDETFAKRCGFQFAWADDFFGGE